MSIADFRLDSFIGWWRRDSTFPMVLMPALSTSSFVDGLGSWRRESTATVRFTTILQIVRLFQQSKRKFMRPNEDVGRPNFEFFTRSFVGRRLEMRYRVLYSLGQKITTCIIAHRPTRCAISGFVFSWPENHNMHHRTSTDSISPVEMRYRVLYSSPLAGAGSTFRFGLEYFILDL